MSDLFVAVAGAVGGAILQEVVSRTFSFALGKRKEKASQGEYQERLLKAVRKVEFVLERTAKLPITDVTLLRDRFELKRDFIEAAECLLSSTRKKRQQETTTSQEVVACSSSPLGLSPTTPSHAMFYVSSSIATSKDDLCLSCDDVERFERLAASARTILTDVQSGCCSPQSRIRFRSPLVSSLFEGKTLRYRAVQADQERGFELCPAWLVEGCGVEAYVYYWHYDYIRPDKSFDVELLLRLSESTDVVGIAIKCLQSMASQFNFVVADTTTGELTLLASSLQDISYSDSDGASQKLNSGLCQYVRRDPLCCKGKGHTPCANKLGFPEEVIIFSFLCFISAPEYNLRSSTDAPGKRRVTRNVRRQPLELSVMVRPHYDDHFLDDEQRSYPYEQTNYNRREPIDVSIQQLGEMIRPRAISCFLRQPKVTEYEMDWTPKHGWASFTVRNKNFWSPFFGEKAKRRCPQNQRQVQFLKKCKGK